MVKPQGYNAKNTEIMQDQTLIPKTNATFHEILHIGSGHFIKEMPVLQPDLCNN